MSIDDLIERLRFTAKDSAFHGYHGNAALMQEAAETLEQLNKEPTVDHDSIFLNVKWGYWDKDGVWHHNPLVNLSPDEQMRQNQEVNKA